MASDPPVLIEAMSNKQLKELISKAGLPTADLFEKKDLRARAHAAAARLHEAEKLKRGQAPAAAAADSDSDDAPAAPKRRRKIEISDDEDDDGDYSLIPQKTGATKKSAVANKVPLPTQAAAANPFSSFAFSGGGGGGWTSRVKDDKTKRANQAKFQATQKKKKAPAKKKKAQSFIAESDEEPSPAPKRRKRGAFAGESDDEESVQSDESSSDEDDVVELGHDEEDAYEKPDSRKAQLAALAERKRRAGAPGRKAPAARAAPAVVDLTADAPPARVSPELAESKIIAIDDDDGSSSGDESDEEAYSKRADALLRACGTYSEKLLAELKKRGLGEKSRGGALSSAAMSATASGDGFVAADAAEVGLVCCDALELQPHQVVGVNWLLLLERVGANGVLADDMGLGKTVQTIAYLQVARSRTTKKSRDVVVVPASTLGNWQREFKRFAPGCAVTVYHGSQAERRQLRTDGDVLRADVVLTTYTWWERDACGDDRSWFASRGPWTHLVLDEGHNLKNPDAQRSKRLRALKAESRTILSGTPIMNRPLDLLSLLLFLMPKLFASCGVTGELPEVLAALERDGEAAGDAGGLNQLRKLLAPFCLRRVKADVLASLPTKTAEVVSVPLSATQRGVYLQVAGRGAALKKGLGDAAAKHLFTELRKAANHPLLLRLDKYDAAALARIAKTLHGNGHFGGAATLAMVTKELESYDDFALHELCAEYADASGDGFSSLGDLALGTNALFESAKCERLRELLPKLKKEGHKVLLFSQWVRLLDLLGLLCDDLDLNWSRLDGSTPITERQQLVADFNDPAGDLDVFLLSTRAGGLGINLTGADTVIIHDVDFNPEIDRQAEDRAHRIGQTKPVTVYRLVAEDTVDRDIIDLANRKRAVNERVMRDGDAAADEESKEDDKEERSAVAAALAKALAQYNASLK